MHKNKLNTIPNLPGVYQFIDIEKRIIYVGKAKNLKNRVKSYFRKNANHSSKNVMLIKNINDIDWIVVRNEVEALMTEANLIKELQPKYNINLKDDKTYPFIQITNEPYPQVVLTRKIIKDGSKYYGPFTDSNQLRIILKVLHKIFPIRSCSHYFDDKVIEAKKISVCLDYHIKRCEGPCEGLVSNHNYLGMINRIHSFMKGKTKTTEEYIKRQMEELSKNQRYEEAAIYRDQLIAIDSFKAKQSQVATDFKERDVVAYHKEGDIGIAVIMRIRNGKIFSRDKIPLKQLNKISGDILELILTRYYMYSDLLPEEISLMHAPSSEKSLLDWFKEKKGKALRFLYPKRGEKAKELRVTLQNAKLLLGEWIINRKKNRIYLPKTLLQLQKDLTLNVPPKIIEAFDISHISGSNSVASMVYFIDGKPKKSNYRKYNIKHVKGVDDYASIREVVYRRYKRLKRENSILPDLILIDGGKGQLNMAVSALRELGLDYISIIALAKRLEDVFIPGNPSPQSIHKHSSGLYLLRKIRDESHRFALAFHRKQRARKLKNSIFCSINGLGEKRYKKLFQSFDGPKQISQATPEKIKSKTGIPLIVAKKIIKLSRTI